MDLCACYKDSGGGILVRRLLWLLCRFPLPPCLDGLIFLFLTVLRLWVPDWRRGMKTRWAWRRPMSTPCLACVARYLMCEAVRSHLTLSSHCPVSRNISSQVVPLADVLELAWLCRHHLYAHPDTPFTITRRSRHMRVHSLALCPSSTLRMLVCSSCKGMYAATSW